MARSSSQALDAPTTPQQSAQFPAEQPIRSGQTALASSQAADVPHQTAPVFGETPAVAHQGPQHLPDDDIVTQQATGTIEVGSQSDSQSDAGYCSGSLSADLKSISSSVRDYAFENGRRYHKFHEGKYHYPNDEAEQDREDMKHAMIVNLCGGRLFYSPIKNPQNIIDLGTGTGIWAVDMGDQFPGASILGVDLSPIQPLWVPPNVKFMVDDLEESHWVYPLNHFDLVHARHSSQAFKDFPKLLARAYKHLKPGGWVELQDMHHWAQCDDGSMRDDYCVNKWIKLHAQGLKNLGPDASVVLKHTSNLEEARFVNVEEMVFKIPIGTWPKNPTMKRIGLYMRTVIIEGLAAISLRPLMRGLGWKREEVEALLVDVRKALMDSSQHTYFTFHAIYGQKPQGAP